MAVGVSFLFALIITNKLSEPAASRKVFLAFSMELGEILSFKEARESVFWN
jgi:hypothetical protein